VIGLRLWRNPRPACLWRGVAAACARSGARGAALRPQHHGDRRAIAASNRWLSVARTRQRLEVPKSSRASHPSKTVRRLRRQRVRAQIKSESGVTQAEHTMPDAMTAIFTQYSADFAGMVG
jgi:hypothetical protein